MELLQAQRQLQLHTGDHLVGRTISAIYSDLKSKLPTPCKPSAQHSNTMKFKLSRLRARLLCTGYQPAEWLDLSITQMVRQ